MTRLSLHILPTLLLSLIACGEPRGSEISGGSVRDVCRSLASAQCSTLSRCDELAGSVGDCVTSGTFECCARSQDCDAEAIVEAETEEACTASIRSASCAGTTSSSSCVILLDDLYNPPVDSSVIDETFCAEVRDRELSSCPAGPSSACSLLLTLADLEPECPSEVSSMATCVASTDCGDSCLAEFIALLECRDGVCECTDGQCSGTDPRCPGPPKRFFTSEAVSILTFGGTVAGADSFCAGQASSAGLPGEWRAFFGSAAEPIEERFTEQSYQRLDGTNALRIYSSIDGLSARATASALYGASGNVLTPELNSDGNIPAWWGYPDDCRGWTSTAIDEGARFANLTVDSFEYIGFTCSGTVGDRVDAHMLCIEQ